MRAAILLAAGASTRMGRPKLELEIDGETILERSLRSLLEASVDSVVVVVSMGKRPKGRPDDRLRWVVNPERDEGLASSLALGARELPRDVNTVVVALADKPLVRPETIRAVIDAFERSDARIAYPVFRGEQGHPVVFDRTLVPELMALRGDRGAKSLLSVHRDEVLEVTVEDPGVCIDIDTPEDYERARRSFR